MRGPVVSFWRFCLAVATMAWSLGTPVAAADGEALSLAVIPAAPPVTMHTLWTPFVELLARSSGLTIRLKLYERMADFEQDIWKGNPDLIFASPIQTVVAHQANGYQPLVRGAQMVAIGLFVRKDSPVRSVDDLAGKKISFVGNKNLCSVAMQHLLAKRGKQLAFEKEYAGSTRNVIANVLLGKSDAGSVFLPEMAHESAATRDQLREVATTPDIAPHPLSAHPRLPPATREAIRKAALAVAATAEGAQALKSIRLEAPIAADYDRDYRPLEQIDIKGLTNWGQ